MPHSTLYMLVLVAAVAHAAWNAMVKSSGDRLLMLTAIRFVGLVVGLVVTIFVPPPAAASIPFLLAAAAVHYLYYALMLSAYRVGDMSQIYPIARGVAPLLVALLAAALAGEYLGVMSLTGVAVVSSGIFLLARSGLRVNANAVFLSLLTGVAIAGYSFLSGLGIRRAQSPLGYIAWLEIMTGLGMFSVALLRRRHVLIEFATTQWRTGLMAGLLSVTGYAIALWAMSTLAMAPVVALRETSVVFAAIIGSVILREGFAARRAVSAITILAGIILLVLDTNAK